MASLVLSRSDNPGLDITNSFPQPSGMINTPPQIVGRDVNGFPKYLGYSSIQLQWNVLDYDQMSSLLRYYSPNWTSTVSVTYDDPITNTSVTKTGYMQRPTVGHAEVLTYYDISVTIAKLS